MIDLYGRIHCPRCGGGCRLDWETDRAVLACWLCGWQVEGESFRERQRRADLDAHPHGPLTKGGRPRADVEA